MGACLATWAALTFAELPAWLLLPIMALLGMLGGAAWAWIPGQLRARGLVNETISTLLLNPVAALIVSFFIFGYWHSPMDTNKTAVFAESARLPRLFDTRIDLGLIMGLALLALFWYVMRSTRWGLEMRALGGNPLAARLNGLPARRYTIVVLCLGGAVAGLAGMALVSGYYGALLANFSRGIGFMGFLVCWLADGSALGIVVTSFVVSIILAGGNLLQLTRDLPYSTINILLAITLFVVLARPSFTRMRSAHERSRPPRDPVDRPVLGHLVALRRARRARGPACGDREPGPRGGPAGERRHRILRDRSVREPVSGHPGGGHRRCADEHGPRLPGHQPKGQPAGEWPGADVLRYRPERLDRRGLRRRQDRRDSHA